MRKNLGFFIAFWPWAGNFRGEVQGPLLLIQYTCYLILDTRHLILDTCTYNLYLDLILVFKYLILELQITFYSRVTHKGSGGYR